MVGCAGSLIYIKDINGKSFALIAQNDIIMYRSHVNS